MGMLPYSINLSGVKLGNSPPHAQAIFHRTEVTVRVKIMPWYRPRRSGGNWYGTQNSRRRSIWAATDGALPGGSARQQAAVTPNDRRLKGALAVATQ